VDGNPIILFDGVCNFCSGVVNFIIERDTKGVFRFAPLQSDAGQRILEHFELAGEDFDTFVLVEGEQAYIKSTAALRMCRLLGGFWKLLYVFIVIPPPIRDALYDYIARNRYR
jgi:predicted DCC family thiol-disulfide oxidoreductase YuxK